MKSRTEFIENQLGLYFSVGPADLSEKIGFERQKAAVEALEKAFNEQAETLFGEPDATLSDDFRYVPIELCELDFETSMTDGMLVGSVWFHSPRPFDDAQARTLRTLALEAYRSVCGEAARFMKAEMHRTWHVRESGEFVIEG